MNMSHEALKKKKLLFVMGPTATGKSDWALELALKLKQNNKLKDNIAVVNCDSVQVYQGTYIGGNQPSSDDKNKVKHFLFDYVSSPNEMTAGEYRDDFLQLLSANPDISNCIVVGGTGFYFQALEKGMAPVPEVPEKISTEVSELISTEKGRLQAWNELETNDPEALKKLHINDTYRLNRALVLLRSGTLPSDIQKYRPVSNNSWMIHKTCLSLEKQELSRRVQQRTRLMLQAGLIEETKGLLSMSHREWQPLQAVGYKQVLQFIDEGKSLEWLEQEICLRTLQLAKRQRTWFQKQESCDFYDAQSQESRSQFLLEGLRFFENEFKTES